MIYIGKSLSTRTYFERLISEVLALKLHVAENAMGATGKMRNLESQMPVVVFYEKGNQQAADIDGIRQIRENMVRSYILLVTDDNLSSEERSAYLLSGAKEIISPLVKAEALRQFFEFIAKYHGLLKQTKEKQTSLEHFKMPRSKRIFDVVFSLLALLFLAPLLLLVALAIRIESKGPVIYKSKRVGSNYKVFEFLKFRSMYQDADKRLKEFGQLNQYSSGEDAVSTPVADSSDLSFNQLNGSVLVADAMLVSDDMLVSEDEYLQNKRQKQVQAFVKLEKDPRVTRVGHFIRKYSIDELPQLINVLKGDMSIVGNRPLPLYEAELLTADESIERFAAPAGLTGLWQVEKRGDAGRLSAEERKQLDVHYAHNYSIGLDLKIILKTITAFVQKGDV